MRKMIKISGGYQLQGGGSFRIVMEDKVYIVWSNKRNISHFPSGKDGYVVIDAFTGLSVSTPALRKKLVALVWPMVDQI